VLCGKVSSRREAERVEQDAPLGGKAKHGGLISLAAFDGAMMRGDHLCENGFDFGAGSGVYLPYTGKEDGPAYEN
jgi:hypothetical protein